jgi:hypothetical protein
MMWCNGMVVPERFRAGTSVWVLNGFLRLTVPNAGGELAGWQMDERLPT